MLPDTRMFPAELLPRMMCADRRPTDGARHPALIERSVSKGFGRPIFGWPVPEIPFALAWVLLVLRGPSAFADFAYSGIVLRRLRLGNGKGTLRFGSHPGRTHDDAGRAGDSDRAIPAAKRATFCLGGLRKLRADDLRLLRCADLGDQEPPGRSCLQGSDRRTLASGHGPPI